MDDQAKALKEIVEWHCLDCQVGSYLDIVDQESPGTMVDHMYGTQKVKYASLWEIYEGAGNCFTKYNPPDKRYEPSVENWSLALLTYGKYLHGNVNAGERASK